MGLLEDAQAALDEKQGVAVVSRPKDGDGLLAALNRILGEPATDSAKWLNPKEHLTNDVHLTALIDGVYFQLAHGASAPQPILRRVHYCEECKTIIRYYGFIRTLTDLARNQDRDPCRCEQIFYVNTFSLPDYAQWLNNNPHYTILSEHVVSSVANSALGGHAIHAQIIVTYRWLTLKEQQED